ncbi:uncharacterized protein LOC133795549 [Humulus lupulus]|uniref:uncharacterized protein LOC133795549 n=1 Tax=Humulus lupulus TaxID=3486 RepID=UPI002B406EC2|nr:uncharacterized protein LOC133795549 [Humulus lupulus]
MIPTFKIVDDSQLMFYMDLKKKETDLTKYPLCLTTEINSIRQSFFSNRSTTTHNQLYDEVAQAEEEASNSDDELVLDCGAKEVVDFIDYANSVSNQIIEMLDKRNDEEEVIDIDEDLVINNKHHQEISLSQIYKDKDTLKTVLSHYAISNHFQYCVQKSCKNEYFVACLDKNCKWMLRASRNGNTNQFIIRRFSHIHTCALEIRLKNQRQPTLTIIADMIKHKFTDIKTKYTAADIVRDLKHDHEVQVKYSKAWRSREKAIEKVRGKAAESYAELPSYLYMLHHTNIGSYIELKADEDGKFLYDFVALNASIKGWNYCVPVVIVDGTFLKSAYGGTLLVAATQDAEGRIFPLAFCVVDSENDDSWEWFFENFKKAYGVRECMSIVFDRHESIIKATNTVYPEVPHGACTFHLLKNMKSKFKKNSKKFKDTFFAAANAYTVKKFEYHMRELDMIDNRLQPYLQNIGYNRWARVHSPHNRYSNMTSNIAESLNSAIVAVRELPICTMLECLRGLVQQWSWTNRKIANATSTKLTEKHEGILNDNYIYSLKLTVHPTNHILYEVRDDVKKSIVDLNSRTCTCNRFQMDQLPCAHAIAILKEMNQDRYQYCSPYYSKEAMVATYQEIVYPIGNEDTWKIPEHIKAVKVHPPEGRIRVAFCYIGYVFDVEGSYNDFVIEVAIGCSGLHWGCIKNCI